jgi:hypothetical protein
LDFTTGCAGPCVSTTPASTSTASNQANRSDIAIDPVTGYIFLSYFSALPTPLTVPAGIATGILSTQSTEVCTHGLTTSAWSTVRAHATAAQGTLGLRVVSDGTYHYLASLTAAAGTSIVLNKIPAALSANWNISPDQVSIETITNGAIGGFAYDSSTSTLWGSYGALTAAGAGAIGQDIKVFDAFESEINATTGFVTTKWIDQTNFVASSTAVPMLDAAIAPNGNVGYAFFYQEPGTAGPNSHLYYGVRGGGVLAPIFGERMVSNSIVGATTFMNGLHPSLTYDPSSNPWISFLDQGIAANTGYLTVASSNNGGATFTLERVDGSTASTRNVGQYTAIDVTSDYTVGVAYYDYSTGATGQRLKFAKKTKNGGWRRFVVDGPGSSGTGCDTNTSSTIGLYAQFQWTSTGRPVIVYQGAVSGIKSLKLAYATEAESTSTYTWTCLTLDSSGQGSNIRGEGIDLYLDSNDLPYIAHYDSTASAIRVVTCPSGSGVLTCAATGSSAFSGERPNYVVGTITSIASKPGIRVDSNGKIWISFHSPSDSAILIASKTGGTSGSWDATPETVSATPSGVSSTYTGQHGSLVLNSSQMPLLFYRSFENWIRYYSKEPQ